MDKVVQIFHSNNHLYSLTSKGRIFWLRGDGWNEITPPLLEEEKPDEKKTHLILPFSGYGRTLGFVVETGVSTHTQNLWITTYHDVDWIKTELLKAYTYYTTNKRKAPKSPKGWSLAFSGWLSRGWEYHRKGISTEPPLEEFLKEKGDL